MENAKPLLGDVLGWKFPYAFQSTVLLKVLDEAIELTGSFVGPVRDGLKFFIVQVALIVSNVKLGPHFSSRCLGNTEEIDKLSSSSTFESLGDI